MPALRLRRTVAALAAVVAAGALTTTTAVVAHAEAWTHTDPTGDVTKVAYIDEADDPVLVAVPDQTVGDIRSIRAAHNSTRLAIQFSLRAAMTQYGIAYRIVTPRAEYRLLRLRMGDRPTVTFSKRVGPGLYDFKSVGCRGVAWKIDWSAAKVAVSLPRACIGYPRFLRVGLTVWSPDPESNEAYTAYFTDDALRTGGAAERSAVSPRIHRN